MKGGAKVLSIAVCVLSLLIAAGIAAAASTKANEFVQQVSNYLQVPDAQDNMQSAGFMLRGTYEGLLTYKTQEKVELEPCLATSWEISSDGLVYTFHLRHNVVFHDGTLFTAEAVKLSFDRIMTLKLGKLGYIEGIVGSVEVVDDYTVRILLTNPVASILARLANIPIVSPTPILQHPEDMAKEWYASNMDGTGPYMLDYFDPPAETALKRFDGYWGGWEGKHFDNIRFVTVPDALTARQMLLAGDVDAIWSALIEDYPLLRANPDVQLVPASPPTYYTIAFNCLKFPTNNRRVREAISLALDHETVISLIGGRPLNDTIRGPVAETNYYYDETLPAPEYNLERARQLLAEAGFPGGKGIPPIELVWSRVWDVEAKTVQVLQEGLKQIGINAVSIPMNFAPILSKESTPETAGQLCFIVSDPTIDAVPDQLMQNMYHTGGIYDFTFFSRTPDGLELDPLIEQAVFKTDDAARLEIYRQLQQLLTTEYVAIWAFKTVDFTAMRSDVRGYVLVPAYEKYVPFYHMWKDR